MISSYRKLSFEDLTHKGNNNILSHLPEGEACFTCASGRGGLEVCIKLLGLSCNDTALMPALIPEGVMIPFNKGGVKIEYFDLKRDLQTDVDQLIKNINENPSIRCLVIIHYLGHPEQNIVKIKQICDESGIYLIEDCAQALFSRSKNEILLGTTGDISLFSLPKTIPVVDGAVFNINSRKIKYKSNSIEYRYSLTGWLAKVLLFINLLLNNYLDGMKPSISYWKLGNLNKHIYHFYYRLLKRSPKPMKMSYVTRRIIRNLNHNEIIERIKSNLTIIYTRIDREKYNLLFKDYDPNYILMGVPITTGERDKLRSLLRSKGILCFIYDRHWNYIPQDQENMFPNALNVLENILILPVSYKTESREVIKMVDMLNQLKLD